MATTASDIQAQAMIDSWLKSQSVKDMQTSIDDAYNAGVAQAEASNKEIMNQLNQNKIDYQNQYDKGAKGAYVNKMQNIKQVDDELARLGLTDSGFGISQKLFADSIYSQNLQGLNDALQSGLRDTDNKINNQNLKLQAILAGLAKDKAGDMFNYNKYITDKSDQIRENERDNYYREQELLRQQELDRFKQEMAQKEYNLALKEANDRAYYNSLRVSGGGKGAGYSISGDGAYIGESIPNLTGFAKEMYDFYTSDDVIKGLKGNGKVNKSKIVKPDTALEDAYRQGKINEDELRYLSKALGLE